MDATLLKKTGLPSHLSSLIIECLKMQFLLNGPCLGDLKFPTGAIFVLWWRFVTENQYGDSGSCEHMSQGYVLLEFAVSWELAPSEVLFIA